MKPARGKSVEVAAMAGAVVDMRNAGVEGEAEGTVATAAAEAVAVGTVGLAIVVVAVAAAGIEGIRADTRGTRRLEPKLVGLMGPDGTCGEGLRWKGRMGGEGSSSSSS